MKWLALGSQTVIKDVVDEEEEEEMWSTLTQKIKPSSDGAEDTRRVRELAFSVHNMYRSHSPDNSLH